MNSLPGSSLDLRDRQLSEVDSPAAWRRLGFAVAVGAIGSVGMWSMLFDCGNRILSKRGRSPMLGYAVLLRLNNVNAANQMPAHGARLWSDWLALQYYFRPELITVSALPWLTPGQSFLFGPCSSLPTIYSAEFVSSHLRGVRAMTNLLEQAINSNDGDAAAKLI